MFFFSFPFIFFHTHGYSTLIGPVLLLFSHKSILLINFSLLIISELVLIIFSSSNRIFFWNNEGKGGIQKKSSPWPYLFASVFREPTRCSVISCSCINGGIWCYLFVQPFKSFSLERNYQLLVRELPRIPMIPYRKPGCMFSRVKAKDESVGEFQNFATLNDQN